jgi:hypothetical protein
MALLIVIVIVFVAVFFLVSKSMRKCNKSKGSCKGKKEAIGGGVGGAAPVVNDYNSYLLNTGLEKAVVDSHKRFVDDVQRTTTGASAQSVLSGDVFDVPFVGLRRPNLQDVYVDPNSRSVPTAEQWQMPGGNRYYRCGLF